MRNTEKTLTIRTPEGIVFPLIIANPLSRFLALMVDNFVILAACTVVVSLLGLLRVIDPDLAGALWLLSLFLISYGYPIVFEWRWQGQTLGKKLLRIQVMDVQGLRLQFSQIVVRNLLRCVDSVPAFYLVGGVAAFLSMRGQRLGDLAANTIVVHHPKIPEPDLSQALPGKFNSFRDYPHLASRLRQSTSPAETGIAVQALLRRDSIDPEARPKLFARIRARLEQKAGFPPEVTDGISDEQYVRNAVDILLK
jgi:uncharacterized RDD family membrane protein YckC